MFPAIKEQEWVKECPEDFRNYGQPQDWDLPSPASQRQWHQTNVLYRTPTTLHSCTLAAKNEKTSDYSTEYLLFAICFRRKVLLATTYISRYKGYNIPLLPSLTWTLLHNVHEGIAAKVTWNHCRIWKSRKFTTRKGQVYTHSETENTI